MHRRPASLDPRARSVPPVGPSRPLHPLSSVVAIVAVAVLAGACPTVAAGPTTVLVSVGPGGSQGRSAGSVEISADGSVVAFVSETYGMVDGGTMGTNHVFVRVLADGVNTLASVNAAGDAPGDGWSHGPSLSGDGTRVAFVSEATDLVASDPNGHTDVFLRDLSTEKTRLVSGTAARPANGDSGEAVLARNGRYVAFASKATNLVKNDGNRASDVFLHDRDTGRTTCISVSSAEVRGNGASSRPAISATGRYVAFWSTATNLVPGDTNGTGDVFLRDRVKGTTTRISISDAERQATRGTFIGDVSMAVSDDGRYVAFVSGATLSPKDKDQAEDVFVRDRQLGTTRLVNRPTAGLTPHTGGNNPPWDVSMSASGRWIAFTSYQTDLVAEDTNGVLDVFVRDMVGGGVIRGSSTPGGAAGGGYSSHARISADGRWLAFDSEAGDLVPDDTNVAYDAFVRGPLR